MIATASTKICNRLETEENCIMFYLISEKTKRVRLKRKELCKDRLNHTVLIDQKIFLFKLHFIMYWQTLIEIAIKSNMNEVNKNKI